jgi:hypothetical protein
MVRELREEKAASRELDLIQGRILLRGSLLFPEIIKGQCHPDRQVGIHGVN